MVLYDSNRRSRQALRKGMMFWVDHNDCSDICYILVHDRGILDGTEILGQLSLFHKR